MYLADNKKTAYAETLSMARVGNQFRTAVVFAASQFGISLNKSWTTVTLPSASVHIPNMAEVHVGPTGYAAGTTT